MSTQSFKRDLIKSNADTRKLRKSISNQLESALQYNQQLEQENTTLRAQVHDLAVQNENLLESLNNVKEEFKQELEKLRQEMTRGEADILESGKKWVEQQKKFVEEIKKLRRENESLKQQKLESEKNLAEKLQNLESQLKQERAENDYLKSSAKESEEKSVKYKTKLKHAVSIVNDLNQIIAEYKSRPGYSSEMTQTDEYNSARENRAKFDCSQSGDMTCWRELNTENLLLSDIFFKPKMPADSDIELFSVKSNSKCNQVMEF